MSLQRDRAILILSLCIGAFTANEGRAQDGLANQQLADAVAQALRHSGRLKHYQIDIQAAAGTVDLLGKVTDAEQRDEALRLAKSVPGVRQVRDRLLVLNDHSIIPVQADDRPEQGPAPKKITDQGPALPPNAVMPGIPSVGSFEPMPFNSCSPNDLFMKPPPLPPYAWPTYAPYNNYSRVAYPTLYPADAWPGIGPFYPFPKVPTGWRSVTLTWQDGYWWYGKGVNGHDWWRVRYK